MDKKHKELLLVQRANLVENLNMNGGLFTQLICRKIIDQRMVRKIKNGKTEDEQAEDLLDYLPKSGQGEKTFDLFCEALIADSQSNIVKSYLKPESTKDEKTKTDTEESTSCSSDNKVLQLGGTTCSQAAQDEHGQSRDGSVASPGYGPTVAIREEFQQQLYRRSIEPRDLQRSQSSPVMENSSEHEARYLYENSLRNPNAVFRILSDRCSSRVEKENQLFNMGLSLSSISQLMNEYHMHTVNDVDKFLVKDSAGKLPKCVSSKELSEKAFAQAPSVFHLSPHKEINLSSLSHPMRSDSQKPFAFHVKEQNYPVLTQSVLLEADSPGCLKSNRVIDKSLDVKNFHRQLSNNNFAQNFHGKNEMVNFPKESRFAVQEIHSSPSKIPAVRPDIIGIERYVEVSGNGGQHRSMVAFPRHVTMLPASHQPDLHSEESFRGENLKAPRLARNDSVDTMQKRPLEEPAEMDGKRFREDVDTCSVPNLVRPEKLPTLRVIDPTRPQTIPVFEEPGRKPSMPAVVVETDEHLEKSQRSSLLGAMDDPEIDLTDGPINVNVELSSRQFYLTHYKQAYAMRRIPRGKALIVNVNEVVGKSARRGTDIDRDNLHNLLCQMHFDVTVYNDTDGLTALEMVQKLQDFSQHTGHAQGDCTVVCILSHGEEGYIFGADGKKFELDAVFSLFDNTCCPNLRGKPKIFIIQACRGGALDRGVQYYPDEHDGSDARIRQVPSMSDMLICYPTQNGYYAWRNRDRGSWYVEALVQVFMKYARCEDVCTMLNRVNLLVSKKVSHCPNIDMDQMSQMSEYKSTLRMPHLYFFPGIGGCS